MLLHAPLPYHTDQANLFVQPVKFKGRRISLSAGSLGVTVPHNIDMGNINLGYAFRERSAGKPTTIGGQIWRPCRPFYRFGRKITFHDGVTIDEVYDQGSWWKQINQGPGYVRFLSDYRYQGVYHDTPMTMNERNRLNTELLLKIGQRKVNYGEFLAESRETISMLAKTTQTLVRAVLAARKGQWWKVPKILGVPRQRLRNGDSASNKWLAYQYGWLPMMSDVYDSYNLFKKGLTRGPQMFSAVRNIKIPYGSEESVGDFSVTTGGWTEITNSAKCWYRISDSALSPLHQLGLINPMEVAWAVVPFSFVVDWFLPVGSVLEAVSARFGVTFVDGYYGRKCVTRYFTKRSFSTSTYKLVSTTWRCQTDAFSYRRTKMTALPWPSWYFKSPFSTTHVVSALALLRLLWR